MLAVLGPRIPVAQHLRLRGRRLLFEESLQLADGPGGIEVVALQTYKPVDKRLDEWIREIRRMGVICGHVRVAFPEVRASAHEKNLENHVQIFGSTCRSP